jgi:SAM-dependent methyltransferase
MMTSPNSSATWGSSNRLVASEKWKAKSAIMGAPVTQALVEYSRPKPGMTVLDLGCGTGEPAISIAALLGPHGNVTALDQSAEILEIASERAQQRGLTNITMQQANANRLPFPDCSFDLITCRFSVMFFGESALSEACRVLKPGSRACFAAWGPFEQPYWASTMGIVHKHVGGPLLPPKHDPFKYSQPGSLSAVLQEAGFAEVEEQTVTLPWTWMGTPEDAWEQMKTVTTPFRPMLERVPAEQWDEINREVVTAVQQYIVGDEIRFGAAIVLAAGSKG